MEVEEGKEYCVFPPVTFVLVVKGNGDGKHGVIQSIQVSLLKIRSGQYGDDATSLSI
jgi:hypothetical protein